MRRLITFTYWRLAALSMAAGLLLYGLGLWAAAEIDGTSASATVCLDPAAAAHWKPERTVAAVVMALGAVWLVVLPCLAGIVLFRQDQRRRATAGAWSLALNSAALVAVCGLLRVSVGIDRGSFLAAWTLWSALLITLAGRRPAAEDEIRGLWRQWKVGMAIGLAAVSLAAVVVHREHFLQCFNGDGTEQFELARSLRGHVLPYWEIEAVERMGTPVVNPALMSSYWNLPGQTLLGEGEFATRLPWWITWLGIFAVALRMIQGERNRGVWLAAVPLGLVFGLNCLWSTFYVGYDAYMVDPACPAMLDAWFTLFLLLALHCLGRGDSAGWVVMMVLASLVYYAGPVLFCLTAAAAWVWRPVPRMGLVAATATGLAVLATIAAAYLVVGWREGSLAGWLETMQEESIGRYFAPGSRWWSAGLYAAYFVLGAGGVTALGLVRAFWKNTEADAAWNRTVATVTLGYVLIVLGSGPKNLHYLSLVLPLPAILWLKIPAGSPAPDGRRRAAALAATVSLAVCLWLCWPLARPIFTVNRQVGSITTFLTDSRPEAYRWARIADAMYKRGQLGWYLGEHTWVGYSELAARPDRPRVLVVTRGGPPSPEYRLVFDSPRAKLYSRDPGWTEWLAQRRPPTGEESCPRVMRPVARRAMPR